MPGLLEGKLGTRPDGTQKGMGYLGLLPMAENSAARPGDTMSEISVGVEIDGEEVLIPSIVPTLDDEELEYLRNGGSPLLHENIMQKAVAHARERMEAGLSPFVD